MSDITSSEFTDRLLSALGEQLAVLGQRFELVVVGGSALLALGLIERSTRDIDLLAVRTGTELDSAKPLPPALEAARGRVARDFSLPVDWLNPGPTDLLEFGLPEEFVDRLELPCGGSVEPHTRSVRRLRACPSPGPRAHGSLGCPP